MTAVIFGASGGIGQALAQNLAASGVPVWAGSRSGRVPEHRLITPFAFDLADDASIAAAAAAMAESAPTLVIIASGILSPPGGKGPERSIRAIDGAAMLEVLQANTIGPAMIAKHMLPLLPRDSRAVFAALSARVGSIGDNRLGGWHSYRASKAALNMLLRNFAIELSRTHPMAVVAGLHPGTVATGLSQPFQRNVPEGALLQPEEAAAHLLEVMAGLGPQDSGGVFDWRGERLPD